MIQIFKSPLHQELASKRAKLFDRLMVVASGASPAERQRIYFRLSRMRKNSKAVLGGASFYCDLPVRYKSDIRMDDGR